MPFWRLRQDVHAQDTFEVSTKGEMLLLDILKELRKMTRSIQRVERKVCGSGPPDVPSEEHSLGEGEAPKAGVTNGHVRGDPPNPD